MIIKSITLNNIRSYTTPDPIELNTGITLFEGDVGCGKSTILTAIEFALFGLGEIDGSYLLRHGERNGSVLLEFSVNDRTYKVFRSLERKRTSISQKEGYLVEAELRTDYSVTEMKVKVLEILNFNENPRPKTSSLIYRYAIFTPQEMMKEVLFQPVERRLETLRRAFRIEDYSITYNNAGILLSRLESESRILDAQTSDLPQKSDELKQENLTLKTCQDELKVIGNQFNLLKDQRTIVSDEIEQLQPKKEQVLRLEVEIPLTEKEIKQLNGQLEQCNQRGQQLTNELSAITEAEQCISRIAPLYEEYLAKSALMVELDPTIEQIRDLSSRQGTLLSTISVEKQHLSNEITAAQTAIDEEKSRIIREREKVQKIPSLLEEESGLDVIAQTLDQIASTLMTLNQDKSAIKQKIADRTKRAGELNGELSELRTIGIGAPCPKCKQDLTQTHFSKVEQGYLTEIGECESAIMSFNQEIAQLDAKIADNTTAQKTAKQAEKRLGVLRPELARLKQQEERIIQDEEKLTKALQILENNKQRLQQEQYGETERAELTSVTAELEQLQPRQTEYDEAKSRLRDLDKSKIKENYISFKEKVNRKNQVLLDQEGNSKKVESLNKDILNAQNTLKAKKQEYDKEKGVLQVIKDLEAKKTALNTKCEEINGSYIGKQKDISRCLEEIARLQAEITDKEDKIQKTKELDELQRWLSEYFMPAVKLIETNVLSSINNEFNSLFQKWLNRLIESGDIMVRVDENFTPIVEQNGYEMEVGSLSGGEKTSVALAYRLALNVMVKKVCKAMQSNLLILDEPTDGFSREQLFKLRDILDELKCEQVIAVSHESELEGFVDRIYKIRKEEGISKIISE
jgi:exonuclease SbcC